MSEPSATGDAVASAAGDGGVSPAPLALDYAPQAGPGQSLGDQASRGFAWLMAQTIALKVVSAGGQIVIAWLLTPGDFGLVGLTYTIAGFVGVVQQTGVREVLIARHAQFRRWATAGAWIALCGGLLALAGQVAIGPFVGHIYPKLSAPEATKIAYMLVILGLAAPFNALSVVPLAKLSSDLRFRVQAAINVWQAVATLLLTIGLAAPPLRLGAYSLVLPRTMVAAATAGWLWWDSRPPVRWRRLHLRRWRSILADGGWNVLTWFFGYVVLQGDYLMLGTMHVADVVGLYYFAYNLSLQTLSVFTINLWGVLLPTLAKLQQDRVRQTAAFLRAVRLLAVVAVPICLLQAAVAEPVIHIFFKAKWYPVIPVLQILSVGMAVQCQAATIQSLLMAQSRFRTAMMLQGIGAAVFLALVYTGSALGHDTGRLRADVTVATAVTMYFLLYGPVMLYAAIRGQGQGRWRDVARVLLPPLGTAAVAGGVGMLAARALPASLPLRDWLAAAVTTIVMAAVYVAVIRVVAQQACADLAARLGDLLGNIRRRLGPVATR